MVRASNEPLKTYTEAAEWLGISEKALQRLVRDGVISPTPIGKRSVRFLLSVLRAYAERQTEAAASTASLEATRKSLAAAGLAD